MSNSKQIKDSFLTPDKENFLTPILRPLKHAFYYPVQSFISIYSERISRSLAFAKHGWLHYDFESAYLYDIMAFKLKRILPVLENGHVVQNDEDIAALKEAIGICERLFKNEYDDKFLDAHYAVYPMVDIGEPQPKRTEEEYKVYRDSFMKAISDGEKARFDEIDRLGEILKKHEPSWWD